MLMEQNMVEVDRVIAAPASAIFVLLADASNHLRLDGSGNIQKSAAEGPQPLRLGTRFVMHLKHGDVDYTTESHVVAFEQDRVIAWQTYPEGKAGTTIGGRVWRYDLEPVDGGTRVRESWDITDEIQQQMMKSSDIPQKVVRSMNATLDRITEIVTG
ncbi:MAG: hypothetical protein JWN99_2389 [Ilumatobacteraceae bacterium]|nr:hypothetical protein [Ilumatobacteraceae bacterium]